MELLHPHGSEQTGDHHVDVRLHLLEGDVHPLLGGPVEEILDTADIWKREWKEFKQDVVSAAFQKQRAVTQTHTHTQTHSSVENPFDVSLFFF